jgi:hypothetical protein
MKYKTGVIAAICIAIAAVAVIYIPTHLIQPFKSQTKETLVLSYYLRTWAPVTTIFLFVVAILVCISFWRTGIGGFRKAVLILLLLPVGLATWFAHQNHFQWMFHPMEKPNYAIAGAADFISGKDMVLGVSHGGDSAAYPVRVLAYHHLVHDRVGGKPIVATY